MKRRKIRCVLKIPLNIMCMNSVEWSKTKRKKKHVAALWEFYIEEDHTEAKLTFWNYSPFKDVAHCKIGRELKVVHLYLLICRIYGLTFIFTHWSHEEYVFLIHVLNLKNTSFLINLLIYIFVILVPVKELFGGLCD